MNAQDNDRRFPSFVPGSLVVSVATMCLLLSGCGTTKQVVMEQAPAYQPTPPPPAVKMTVTLAPKLPEVQEAIRRVFKDAAVLDSAYQPNFLTGDFNGDSSQDIAVILKPLPNKLAQMNEEFPPWLLRDPSTNKAQGPHLRVEKDEVLLAVIHGYGANDWRDPEATQTFLLKNVVGANMQVHTGKEFVSANSGRKLPRPQGDLIGQTLRGTSGYLYYAVSNYSWYDPKSFKDEQQTGIFHQPRAMK